MLQVSKIINPRMMRRCMVDSARSHNASARLAEYGGGRCSWVHLMVIITDEITRRCAQNKKNEEQSLGNRIRTVDHSVDSVPRYPLATDRQTASPPDCKLASSLNNPQSRIMCLRSISRENKVRLRGIPGFPSSDSHCLGSNTSNLGSRSICTHGGTATRRT